MNRRAFWLGGVAGLALHPFVVSAALFTPGNLVVVRTGDDTHASDTSAGMTYLDEYDRLGTLVQSIPMADANDTVNPQFTLAGSEMQAGFISRSVNGQYFSMVGYRAPLGTAGVSGIAATGAGGTVDRLVARIDLAGNIDTSTRITDYNGTNRVWSATTNDGNQFWVSGEGSQNQVRYTTLGATTSTRIPTASNINTKVVNVFTDSTSASQLYLSRGSNANAVNTVTHAIDPDPKLPTTTHSSTNPVVVAPLFSDSGASTYDFFFLNDSTLYRCDDVNGPTGGIAKYTRSGSVWTKQYVLQAGLSSVALRGITGYLYGDGVTPILYATSGNGGNLVTVADNGPASLFTTLANVDTLGNLRFHDVIMVVPEPTTIVLLGVGSLLCLRRRPRMQ